MSKKSKTFKIGLTAGIVGLGVFGLTVGLSSLAKYRSESPRKIANDFAAKVSTLAFSPYAFETDSDYKIVKRWLVDSNNNIRNKEKVIDSFSFFTKNGDQLEKINFQDPEYTKAKITFEILEIIPDDVNQNFKVKFQALQKLHNGDIAKSDIYEQTVAFAKQSNLLVAEFNFSLKKITEKLNQQIENLSTKITNFADEKTSSQKDPSTLRAIDFQYDLNTARNPEDLDIKLANYFPVLKNLINRLNNAPENKLPNNLGNIFEFSFAKDSSTNQYVSIQNQIPSLFLKADLSQSAREILASPDEVQPVINILRLMKKDNSSYFLNFEDFVNNLTLKNMQKEDLNAKGQNLSAYEFLADIKSGFFPGDKRSSHTKAEISNLLNKKENIYDFGKYNGKFNDRLNSPNLEYSLDAASASLDKKDKSIILIPYRLEIKDKFFADDLYPDTKDNILVKEGILKLTGFKKGPKIDLPNINQQIFKTEYLPFFEKGKEEQAKLDYGNILNPYNTQLAKVEVEALFKGNKNQEIYQALDGNYAYEFGAFKSVLNSWTGKIQHPEKADIQRFTRHLEQVKIGSNSVLNQPQTAKEQVISSLKSNNFFKNGHQVASYFQDLLTKDKLTVLETLYDLAKKWGLETNQAQFPKRDFQYTKDIFAEADKLKFLESKKKDPYNENNQIKEIHQLSFNILARNDVIKSDGFYGVLLLPQSVKTELEGKNEAQIFEALKKYSLIENSAFKTTILDKNLLEGTDFKTFGDFLKAFFLKAAQFNNFAPWAKLDDNLQYSFEAIKKGETTKEGKREEVDKKVKELDNKIKGILPQPPAAKPEAAKPVAAKPETTKPVAAKPEAAKPVAAKPEAAKPVAAKPEAAKPVATNTNTNTGFSLTNKPKEDYFPMAFSYKLEYTDENKLSLKTPEINVFLELVHQSEYEEQKIIKELDKTVLNLQYQFQEVKVTSEQYQKLSHPMKPEASSNQGKKSEGTPNQGKKAEGAPNQGKKAEGAPSQGKKAEGAPSQGKKAEGTSNQQNTTTELTNYLPELGKKIDEIIKKQGKNWKTEVELIEDNIAGDAKLLYFVLKDDSKSGDPKKSSLKVKITVKQSNNNQELKSK
ncbi:adhesin [Mycoplasma hyopneumoniae]|uniref:cilium adhesin P97 n=1 Tax=Mesomycoplasma hyopneumoniae TaxID=2099 RepID=UPI00136A0731|nr:cilium adhesin P97 [Mesomycoplasma hyopneumoniae]MXR10851.1 adhesin [Mesomycoplasma hyopneumoniae]MXR63897.1 adhesin [Mesomycoplasma hyopneumoniae]